MSNDIYEWPELLNPDPRLVDDEDMAFASWAYKVNSELSRVHETMSRPMHDDPQIMDQQVTQDIEGWLPRVAFLAAHAEYFYRRAEARKLDMVKAQAEKMSMAEAEVRMRTLLAPYRFVRDHLVSLQDRMSDRMRWAQSVRKIVTPQ